MNETKKSLKANSAGQTLCIYTHTDSLAKEYLVALGQSTSIHTNLV